MERTIKISTAAANRDIQNLKNANQQLEQSLKTITRLKAVAGSIQGQTGQAIIEKCQVLETKINGLMENITTSQNLINKVVNDYKEEDRRLKNEILKNLSVSGR